MADYLNTLKEALNGGLAAYLRPSSFKVDHVLDDVNDLGMVQRIFKYDLFLLDRDGTLHAYHSRERVPAFEATLKVIAPRSEIISNSSYDELRRIRDVFPDIPTNKLVTFEGAADAMHLLRFEGGDLHVLRYDPATHALTDETSSFKGPDESLTARIVRNIKKPNPLVIHAVRDFNITTGRCPAEPKIVMVGDRHLTDIVAGNRAGVATAYMTPYKPFSDPLGLMFSRYFLDVPIATVMRTLGKIV